MKMMKIGSFLGSGLVTGIQLLGHLGSGLLVQVVNQAQTDELHDGADGDRSRSWSRSGALMASHTCTMISSREYHRSRPMNWVRKIVMVGR